MAPREHYGALGGIPLGGLTTKGAELRAKRPPPKVIVKTKEVLTKQANEIAKKATEHEHFINKVTYCIGVVAFGLFCYLLGSRPQDIPYLYCAFFLTAAPLRWIYYRSKKWHYFLLDFCYYANMIFTTHLLFWPRCERLFLLCFAFAEGPLAWALIVWRCSLVFSSIDKIVSVLIHLLPGTVFFIIRWWDPSTFSHHAQDDTGPWPAWPLIEPGQELWMWMFVVPLAVYSLWQMLYWIIVDGLRKQRLLNDPEVLTSYRELSRKAARADNVWWRVSGALGERRRVTMYAVLQAVFTVATMALTVPMFLSYRLHGFFQLFKIAASIWNGGNFFFDVMPRQVHAKAEKKKAAMEVVTMQEGLRRPPETPSAGISPLLLAQGASEPPEPRRVSMSRQAAEEGRTLCASCRRASLNNLGELGSSSPTRLVENRSKSLGASPEGYGEVFHEFNDSHADEEIWEDPEEVAEDAEAERLTADEVSTKSEDAVDKRAGAVDDSTHSFRSNGGVLGSFLRRKGCSGQVRAAE